MAIEFQSFGARMRYERERRRISIASIAERTKILGALLEGLENDDLSRWPTGLYRRAFMRAYATAIGLDPESTVKEFLERFPDPEAAPAPVVVSSVSKSALPEPATVDSRLSLAPSTVVRVPTLQPGAWFQPGSLVTGFRRRCLAAIVDFFVVWVLGIATFAVFGQLWAPLAIAAVLYYSLSILLLGNTPGVCFFADADKNIAKGRQLYLRLRLPRMRWHPPSRVLRGLASYGGTSPKPASAAEAGPAAHSRT